jgi:hypothetical protein
VVQIGGVIDATRVESRFDGGPTGIRQISRYHLPASRRRHVVRYLYPRSGRNGNHRAVRRTSAHYLGLIRAGDWGWLGPIEAGDPVDDSGAEGGPDCVSSVGGAGGALTAEPVARSWISRRTLGVSTVTASMLRSLMPSTLTMTWPRPGRAGEARAIFTPEETKISARRRCDPLRW